MPHTPVNLADKLSRITEHWSPRIVGALNGQEIKLAKLQGTFVWHSHPDADELFLVIRGRLDLHLRDGVVSLSEGEFYIVPRGVEHLPVADEECEVLLLEPAGTVNTGDAGGERTVEDPAWL